MSENIYKNEDIVRSFSYNQFPLQVLTGPRGTGKTYPVQDYILNKLKKGKYFIYIRESEDELAMTLGGGFWDTDLFRNRGDFNASDFEIIGKKFLYCGRIVGMGFALSTYGKVRGNVFGNIGAIDKNIAKGKKATPAEEREIEEVENFVDRNIDNVQTLFFDEFVPMTPTMKEEKRVDAIMHIMESLFRFRRKGCRAIFCGNIISQYNMLLEYFNFNTDRGITYGIHKSYTAPSRITGKIDPLCVWVHAKPNKHWLQKRDESIVGMIMRGKDDEMFTTGNAFGDKNINLITENDKKGRVILFNITDGVNSLTFWRAVQNTGHITERTKNTTYPNYTFDSKNISVNIQLMPKNIQKGLYEMYNYGRIKFDSIKSYKIFDELLPNRKNID